MRGYGTPEITAAREIHFNSICRALGYDPVEFRLKNLVEPDGINYRYGETLGGAYAKECLLKGAEKFGWFEKAKRPKDTGRYRRGIGVSSGLHGAGFIHAQFDYSTISIKMNEDGSCSLITGVHERPRCKFHFDAYISEILGIPVEYYSCRL